MAKPNFFIIGAPRSGTTFMQKYLGDHPDIFITPGEPSYFCSDYARPRLSKEDYLNLFEDTEQYKIRGEKTVFYLPSKVALKKISKFNPKAKILVMLRNPIEAVYSFHFKMLSVGRENVEDFEKAWRLQKERKKKKKDKIYRGYLKTKTLFYGEVYKLGKHLKRVYKSFPREQVKVIIFNDLITDNKNTYKEVIDFLELPFYSKEDFSKVNSHKQPKSKMITRLFSLRGLLPVQKIKKLLKIKGQIGISSKIRKLNQTNKKRKPLPENFKKELSDYFEKDIGLLSELLDRDLTHWLED